MSHHHRHHGRWSPSVYGAVWAKRQEFLYGPPKQPWSRPGKQDQYEAWRKADRWLPAARQERAEQRQRERAQRRAAREARRPPRPQGPPRRSLTGAEWAWGSVCVLGLVVAVVSLCLLFVNPRLYGATLLAGLAIWLVAARLPKT